MCAAGVLRCSGTLGLDVGSQEAETMARQGSRKVYRVAQWATGNIGTQAMRAVIDHPQMELVGLYVHSDAKAGRDAGELAGLGREVGVKGVRSLDEILAARPDCVIYTPLFLDVDVVCQLLQSGINVATSVAELHHPDSLDAKVRARVEEACHRGGTSIHATGSSPGFVSEVLPVALLNMSRRLDCLTVDEFADLTSRNSPDLIFTVMGWGKPTGEFSEAQTAHISASFGQSYRQLAAALSVEIDRIETTGEFGLARERTEIAAGVIEAGCVAGTRITMEAYRGDKPVMRFRANWYATPKLDKDWEITQKNGWRIRVEGDTALDVSVTFPVSDDDYPKMTPGLTAHPVVNAVPAICEAAPGIRTFDELKVLPILG
jgi:4-hydroxy-tetrahydrodipicolinate reductase